MGHLDDLELDRLRGDEGTNPHVDGCGDCRARLLGLRGLAAALSSPPPVAAPDDRDAFLVDAARMAGRRVANAKRRAWTWGAASLAAAAALVVMVWRAQDSGGRDVNADGRVDILDAFALARTIERGGALRRQWDFNHDQRVDRADVDWVARAAVSLEKR